MSRKESIEKTIYDSLEEALDEFESQVRSGRLFNVYLLMDPESVLGDVIVAQPLPTRDELRYLSEKPEEEEERKIDMGGVFRFPVSELVESDDPRAAGLVEYVVEGQAFRSHFLFIADGRKQIIPEKPSRRKKAA